MRMTASNEDEMEAKPATDTKSGAVLTDARVLLAQTDEMMADIPMTAIKGNVSMLMGYVDRLRKALTMALDAPAPGHAQRPVVVSDEMVRAGAAALHAVGRSDAANAENPLYREGCWPLSERQKYECTSRIALEAALSASAAIGSDCRTGTEMTERMRHDLFNLMEDAGARLRDPTTRFASDVDWFIHRLSAIGFSREGATGRSLPPSVQGVDAATLMQAYAAEARHDNITVTYMSCAAMGRALSSIGLTDVGTLQRELGGVRSELERVNAAWATEQSLVQKLTAESFADKQTIVTQRSELERVKGELLSMGARLHESKRELTGVIDGNARLAARLSADVHRAERERDEACAQLAAMRGPELTDEEALAIADDVVVPSYVVHAIASRLRARAQKAAAHDQPALHGGALTLDMARKLEAEAVKEKRTSDPVGNYSFVEWLIMWLPSRLAAHGPQHSEHVDRLPKGSIELGFGFQRTPMSPCQLRSWNFKSAADAAKSIAANPPTDAQQIWRIVAIPDGGPVRARVVLEPAVPGEER